MDTTNSSENPQRRVEDRKPNETINWEAPGAPAVPQPIAHPIEQLSPTRIESPIGAAPAATSGDAPADAYSQYVVSCRDEGVLPCSRESFEANRGATSGDAPRDDQWMFDLAAEYESRGNGLYSPVTFTAQQLPKFVQAVVARIESAAAPAPTDALRKAVREMTAALEEREWAEHVSADPDAAALESAITELVGLYNEARAAAPATASGDELPLIVPDWPACNPACDYETPLGGHEDHRNAGCSCEAAKASICRQRAAVSAATKPTAEQQPIRGAYLNSFPPYQYEPYPECSRIAPAAASADAVVGLKAELAFERKHRQLAQDALCTLVRAIASDDERSAFEAWISQAMPDVLPLARNFSDYQRVGTQMAWAAWQARAAASHATKATADLSQLQRHDITHYFNGAVMEANPNGSFYRVADVQSLLATKPAAAPVVPEGFVIVPLNPTPAMNRAAVEYINGAGIYSSGLAPTVLEIEESIYHEVYRAMLAASTTGAAQTAEQVREQQREECWSRDEEDFNHLSLSDLIGCHEDLKPGDTVWVGEAVHPEAAQMVNVDSILENIGEAAYDIGGEHAEDYPDVTADQAKELEQLVVDWLNRSCNTSFWTVTNIKPYVLSAEDFPTPTHSSEAGE